MDAVGRLTLLAALIVTMAGPAVADEANPTREEVIDAMRPFKGSSTPGVDPSKLTGKVMAGYQGWFTAEGDGSGLGWRHYQRNGQFKPGQCSIELWPDVSDLDEDERYPTPFRHADGRVAQVFSSHNKKTVLRHFRQMRDYGIDGVFVQRFPVETLAPKNFRHCNTVLSHCREGANQYGRCYAVMYDLSLLKEGGVQHAIDDWKLLVDRMGIARDEKDIAYVRHRGKPVVAVWGIGFNDDRKYTLEECDRFVEFLKSDPKYGGCTVMVGVPTGWRTLDEDATPDRLLHATLLKADIISPWTIGRYQSMVEAEQHALNRWHPDMRWCKEHGKDYMPVVFPGFSWKNQHPDSDAEPIGRLKGAFLWRQYFEAKRVGATMVYQAMFDELDEGTCVFRCTNFPPVGASKILTYEGLPPDYYLRLTGFAGKLLRGEVDGAGKQIVQPRP